jgi:uncharacterized protein YutE (UPF0331/DUF86 family)
MVDKELVYKQLGDLKEFLQRIEDMDLTFDMILGDEDIQGLLDRRMQKAIESSIDIAAHIVASQNYKQAKSAEDLFLVLGRQTIISQDLAKKMAGAAGLRNIIVHKYSEIDYNLAYSNLEEKLKDLNQFAKQINTFLEEKEKGK